MVVLHRVKEGVDISNGVKRGQTGSNGGTNEVFSNVKEDRIGSDGGCFDRKSNMNRRGLMSTKL